MEVIKVIEQLVKLAGHFAWPITVLFVIYTIRLDIKHLIKAIAIRISDPRFDIELSKDGMKSKLNDLEERTEKVENRLEEDAEQNKIDLKALEWVDIQLSETIHPKFSSEELKNLILQASPLALEFIYQKTKEVRHTAWKEHKKGLIERTIPILEALVRSSHGSRRHRYYAQLGYALKDQDLPDWREAKINLAKAIRLWQDDDPNRPISPFYCFNWVICAVELDNQTCHSHESDVKTRDAIVRGIETAASCEMLTQALHDNQSIQKWLERNCQSVNPALLQAAHFDGDCHQERYLIDSDTDE